MILCQFYAGLCVCSLQLRTVVPPYNTHQVCPIVHPVAVVRSSNCASSLQLNTAPSYRCTCALVHPVMKVTLAHSFVTRCKLVHHVAVVHHVALAHPHQLPLPGSCPPKLSACAFSPQFLTALPSLKQKQVPLLAEPVHLLLSMETSNTALFA